jgi:hypothetical protein
LGQGRWTRRRFARQLFPNKRTSEKNLGRYAPTGAGKNLTVVNIGVLRAGLGRLLHSGQRPFPRRPEGPQIGHEETSAPSRTHVNNVISPQSCQRDVPKVARFLRQRWCRRPAEIVASRFCSLGAVDAPNRSHVNFEEHDMKPPHRRQFLHLAAGAVAIPAVSRSASAQTYPTPHAPGTVASCVPVGHSARCRVPRHGAAVIG